MESVNNRLDKRRFPRIGLNLPLQYKDLKKTQELPTGSLTSNISEGGVCFKSNQFISLACRLVVHITLPSVHKPIKAISKVAWIKKMPLSDQYELGNQFLNITKEDRDAIIEFVGRSLDTSV